MKLSEEVHNCCPFCGGQGFTVSSYNGEPEQEQCQFCYEVAYPLADRIAELEAGRKKVVDELHTECLNMRKERDALLETIRLAYYWIKDTKVDDGDGATHAKRVLHNYLELLKEVEE